MKKDFQIKKPEIIAPAGNREMMKAAVENGADGVYFGLPRYNARMRAENFKLDELPEIMARLHERGVRGYITLNTLFYSSEVDDALGLFKLASDCGADGVMVQDLGIARLASESFPELPIYASTQMSLASAEAINEARAMGINLKRVVLARELSLTELRQIRENTDAELEMFVHGALCVSYSGQCLASFALGGRSANRGVCAQACRLPYSVTIDDAYIIEEKYPVSPKDLCAYEELVGIVNCGIEALKIEGRLKTANYTAAITRAYRNAIDNIFDELSRGKSPKTRLSEDEKYTMEQMFSRGFTRGYLRGAEHQDIVSGTSSKNRGALLGETIGFFKGGIIIRASASLKPGDGIVFESDNPEGQESGGRVYEIFDGADKVKEFHIGKNSGKNKEIRIKLEAGKIDFTKIKIGCKVWKTDDPRLNAELAATYAGEKFFYKRPVDARVEGMLGKPLRLALTDWDGNTAEAEDFAPAEYASHQPLNEAVLREYIGRLGNTPFVLNDISCDLTGDLMVPFSRLNEFRRRAVENLIGQRRAIGRGRASDTEKIILHKDKILKYNNEFYKGSGNPSAEIAVLCRNLEQISAAVSAKDVGIIYADADEFEFLVNAREAVSKDKKFIPATVRTYKPGETKLIRKLLDLNPNGILARNLAAIKIIKEMKPGLPIYGDYSLNVANEFSALTLIENGVRQLSPSVDLGSDELMDLVKRSCPDWLELTVYRHIPMFYMEYCLFCRFLSRAKNSKVCEGQCKKHKITLKDRKNVFHSVRKDLGCRNIVFCGNAEQSFDGLHKFLNKGIRKFRLEFLDETEKDVSKIIREFTSKISRLC